ALETLVLVLAAAAFLALRQRGLVAEDDLTGAVGLPASAPALGALAGALALVRLLPAATALALRRALRSRRPLAVFGAARAADTAGRLLPPLAIVAATALATFTTTV